MKDVPGLKKTVLRLYEGRKEEKKERGSVLVSPTNYLLNSFLTTKGIDISNCRLLERAHSGLVVLPLYVSLRTAYEVVGLKARLRTRYLIWGVPRPCNTIFSLYNRNSLSLPHLPTTWIICAVQAVS